MSSEQKVRDWLPISWSTPNFRLENRYPLNFLHVSEKSRASFAVADCGKIAISYAEIGLNKGSLSVFQQDLPLYRSISTFSTEGLFCHPIVIKQEGKEFLAACTSRRDTAIYMWDLETFVATSVQSTIQIGQHLLCLIDDTTVACVEMVASPDGKNRARIMDISVTPWELKTVLLLRMDYSLVTDVSYLKTTDGTSCLLLSTLGGVSVWAVDMLTGKTKWKTSWDNAYPVSICNDTDKNIYVADYRADQVHVLSEKDGAFSDSVNLREYDIFAPHCIRFHDEFLYLAHKNSKDPDQFQVSKIFKQNNYG